MNIVREGKTKLIEVIERAEVKKNELDRRLRKLILCQKRWRTKVT